MSVNNQTLSSVGYSASNKNWVGYLNEWNVVTKQMTSYHILSTGTNSASSSTGRYGGLFIGGSLVYSAKNNRVYYWGGCSINSTAGSLIKPFFLDLTENTLTNIAAITVTFGEGFGYEDPKTGFVYFGGGFSAGYSNTTISLGTYNPAIYCYDPTSNTYTTVRSDFVTLGLGSGNIHAYITMGDRILDMSATGVVSFNPMTGDTIEGQMPAAFGGAICSGMKAVYANTLYAWVNETNNVAMKKCPFFTSPPDDAPIVCKIYQGQKYHTLVPFEIPRLNLSLTTVQQEAEQDYEIKMYDYSSEGGQVIYIETT